MPNKQQGNRPMTDETIGVRLNQALIQAEAISNEVKRLNELLDQEKRKLNDYQRTVIPALMMEAGSTEMTTASGWSVRLVSDVSISVIKDESGEFVPGAAEWLEEHEPGLIKATVIVYPEDEQEIEQLLIEHEAKATKTVNHQSLHAWARRALKDGIEIPDGLFNVSHF